MSSSFTNTKLLGGLRDGDDDAWSELDKRIRPVLTALGRRFGLSDTEAADVAQETFLRFIESYRAGRYERSRGRLRAWIVGIARHRVHDLFRSRDRRHERPLAAGDLDVPGEDEFLRVWDEECRAHVLRRAMEVLREVSRISEEKLRAFERIFIDQQGVEDVAREMGMTRDEVYQAKFRCLERLREIVRDLELAYELE